MTSILLVTSILHVTSILLLWTPALPKADQCWSPPCGTHAPTYTNTILSMMSTHPNSRSHAENNLDTTAPVCDTLPNTLLSFSFTSGPLLTFSCLILLPLLLFLLLLLHGTISVFSLREVRLAVAKAAQLLSFSCACLELFFY